MDGSRMQVLVDKGYRIAATKIGLPFNLYRPLDATAVVAPGNLISQVPAAFSADNYAFKRPSAYGKATWTALVDGSITQPGDYLVSVTPLRGQATQTFFIAAQQSLLPILVVECNAVLSFLRPGTATNTEVFGEDGYPIPPLATPVISGWPASVLAGTKGEKSDDGLPRDTRQPWYVVLLPALPGVEIRTDDVCNDDRGHRYLVSSAELTDLGWRLSIMYAGT